MVYRISDSRTVVPSSPVQLVRPVQPVPCVVRPILPQRRAGWTVGNTDHKTDDLVNRLDQKTDRTDSKIDYAVYFFIAGLFLKGGFDIWMKGDRDEGNKTTPV